IGVARSARNLDDFRARVRESVMHAGDRCGPSFNREALEKLIGRIRYVRGDYTEPRTFAALGDALGGARRPPFHLAIPPGAVAGVVSGLKAAGCTERARVALEKPFGRDLASARSLDRTLHKAFPEERIFRIDHYLGKEPVQNLLYLRFANSCLE